MSGKPTIVLVHGFRGGAAHWAKVIVELNQRGYDWYQVSTNDRMIHPDSERQMAERMRPQSTIELDASHASLASQPVAIADLIDRAATSLT